MYLFLDGLCVKMLVVAGPKVPMAAAKRPMPIFDFVFLHPIPTDHMLPLHLVVEGLRSGVKTVPRHR